MSSSVKTIISVIVAAAIVGIILLFMFGSFRSTVGDYTKESLEDIKLTDTYNGKSAMSSLQGRERPVIKAKNAKIKKGESVAAVDLIESVIDADGNDLISKIKTEGDKVDKNSGAFSSDTAGIYNITYSITDDYGLTAKKTVTVIVNI